MRKRLTLVLGLAMLTAIVPATTTSADTSVETGDPLDAIDCLVDVIGPPPVPSSSGICGGGGGGDLPADANVDVSDCVQSCNVREIVRLDPIIDPVPVDVPTFYSVECFVESGDTRVTTNETLLNTEPRCPIVGFDTGTTTGFGGFTQEVPDLDEVRTPTLTTVTTGICEVTVEASTVGPGGQTTQPAPCVGT
jgi:hypothetical protein